MAAAARTVGAAGGALVPAEKEQDAAVGENDRGGVLTAVLSVVEDLDERIPRAAVVLGASEDEVDVAVVGRAVDAALGEGEKRAVVRYCDRRDAEGRIAVAAGGKDLCRDVLLGFVVSAAARRREVGTGFVAAAAAGREQEGKEEDELLVFFYVRQSLFDE